MEKVNEYETDSLAPTVASPGSQTESIPANPYEIDSLKPSAPSQEPQRPPLYSMVGGFLPRVAYDLGSVEYRMNPATPVEQQNENHIAAISKVSGLPVDEVKQYYEPMKAALNILSHGAVDVGEGVNATFPHPSAVTVKGMVDSVMTPAVVAGAIASPATTLPAVLAFTALDHIIPTDKFIPSNATPDERATIELMGMMAKGAVVGGVFDGVHGAMDDYGNAKTGMDFLLAKHAYNTLNEKGYPNVVLATPDMIDSMNKIDPAIPGKLGIDAKTAEVAAKNNMPIRIPAEKFLKVATDTLRAKEVREFKPQEVTAIGGVLEDIKGMEALKRKPIIDTAAIGPGEVIGQTVQGDMPEYLKNQGVTKADDVPILEKALNGEPLTKIQHERVNELSDLWQDEQESRYGTPPPEEPTFDFGANAPEKPQSQWDKVQEALGVEQDPAMKFPENPKEDIQIGKTESKGLGEAGFIDPSIIPGVRETADFLDKASSQAIETFSPANVNDQSRRGGEIFREKMGQMARSSDVMEASLAKAKNLFNKSTNDANIDFIDNMERGKKQASPDLQKISDVIRGHLDTLRDKIQTLGTGKLDDFIENYFPHIWKDPEKADNIFKQYFGKRPLEGNKNFLKQRSIEFTKDGIASGLEPVSYNPVDLTLLKAREMQKYLMVHETLKTYKDIGLAKFVKVGGEVPEGWTKIDDKISTVFQHIEDVGLVLRGHYYSPEGVTNIINNYLSPGLRGNYLFDLYRGAGNVLNQFQLGASAFHLGFTSMDATVSQTALGIEQLFDKKPVEGAAKILTSPFAPVSTVLKGDKLLKAWYGNPTDPNTALIADAMTSGGGRARMDQFYSTKATDQLMSSFREGKLVKGVLKIPLSVMEQVSKPIMEALVPRQKMGVFYDMMNEELKLNPNMSHVELRQLAQKAWDSVDNRLGQMVYDNLFWDKTTKDLGMASVRSLGWNIGTVREIGGGILDIPKTLMGEKTYYLPGKEPGLLDNIELKKDSKGVYSYKRELSHRTAYLMAMPIVVGLYGAMYQYLRTGQGPQEAKDYFFPKNGHIDKNGEPARDALPSYMKDIYHYTQSPVQTVLNKMAPQNAMIYQMLTNKDYYGTEIRNEDDPFVQQAVDEFKFVGEQFIPFGFRNAAQSESKDFASQALPFVGVTPAPHDINQTDAEKLAGKYIKEHIPVGAKTKEASEASKLKSSLRNGITADGNYAAVDQAVDEGKITSKERKQIIKDAETPYLERTVKNLSKEEAMMVYLKATPEEQDSIRPIIQKKKGAIRPAMKEKFEELFAK